MGNQLAFHVPWTRFALNTQESFSEEKMVLLQRVIRFHHQELLGLALPHEFFHLHIAIVFVSLSLHMVHILCNNYLVQWLVTSDVKYPNSIPCNRILRFYKIGNWLDNLDYINKDMVHVLCCNIHSLFGFCSGRLLCVFGVVHFGY